MVNNGAGIKYHEKEYSVEKRPNARYLVSVLESKKEKDFA